MQTEELVPAADFCTHHNIEISFINALSEHGLLEIITVQQSYYIHTNQLSFLEKLVRMHYDLDINLEGIEAISHLLQRMEDMQQEIIQLKNRLRVAAIEM